MKNDNSKKPLRARDVGIPFDGIPGPLNAITDVSGIKIGHKTLISGDGALQVGEGPVRTGVTVVMPRGDSYNPVFAAWYALNGNGEMTGTTWIEESGFLEGPIGLTNTNSVGIVRDSITAWQIKRNLIDPVAPGLFWLLPVVAETYDGTLNDINGFHVKQEHVFAALDSAAGGQVVEGCVGGGTGMVCHGFKGGIGTASRRVDIQNNEYTVGVLVQANHGGKQELVIAGVPVGRNLNDIPSPRDQLSGHPEGTGSIIVVVATDAPLLPHQLKRLTRRVPIGLGRNGSIGSHTSGDIFIAFSTANSGTAVRDGVQQLQMLANDQMNALFTATIESTEEAIINALVAAEDLTGINGITAHALPVDRVRELLSQYNRQIE
jgi:D-aminopeptidase